MKKIALNGGSTASENRISIAKPILSKKVLNDIEKVLETGYLRQGPYTKKFELAFSKRIGSKYAYAVNNGTAALHLAYLTTINKGDEVIIPAFTFLATASMVFFAEGRPVFVDVDPETFTIDVESVKERISNKTKAIVPVHLFGNAANIDSLRELAIDHDLFLIHDSAQAHGTLYDGKDVGSFDDLNCYSFYPSKTITTGEGGMVTTNNEEFYKKGCLLRAHGDDGRYHHVMLGLNYRITEIQSILGLDQLEKLDNFLKRRKECGDYLREKIMKVEGLLPQKIEDKVTHSYSYFSLTIDPELYDCSRDEFLSAIRAENIDCAVHYPIPLTRQPAIMDRMNPEECPVSLDLSRRIFSLPIHPRLSDNDLENIVKGVEKVSSHYLK
jgi:dTDP-4-amino-4,6-dideoxygalactose transaminase